MAVIVLHTKTLFQGVAIMFRQGSNRYKVAVAMAKLGSADVDALIKESGVHEIGVRECLAELKAYGLLKKPRGFRKPFTRVVYYAKKALVDWGLAC